MTISDQAEAENEQKYQTSKDYSCQTAVHVGYRHCTGTGACLPRLQGRILCAIWVELPSVTTSYFITVEPFIRFTIRVNDHAHQWALPLIMRWFMMLDLNLCVARM